MNPIGKCFVLVAASVLVGCAAGTRDEGAPRMEIVHSSLAIPADPAADITMQADSAFGRALADLAEQGADANHVVRTRVYVKDFADFKAVAPAHARAFGASGPANTMVQLAEFSQPGMRIMAEVSAAKNAALQPERSGAPVENFFGFSLAMRAGDHAYVTGATGWNAEGKIDDPNDYYGQTKIALGKILDAAKQLGGDASNVVMTRLYIRSFDGFEEVARAHREVFGELRPASTLIEVERFFDPGMVVEIESELYFGERRAIGSDSKWEPWFGFSRSYVTGDTLLISGSTGTGPDVAAQTASSMGHIDLALRRAGHSPDDVRVLRVFLRDMAMEETVRRQLASHYPQAEAFSFIRVPRLATPEMLLEIEAESRRQ